MGILLAQRASDIKLKNTENDLRLVINLKEIFNLPFFPQDDRLRQSIGQEILDKIVERANSADFLSGSSRKGYSKEYAESDAGIVYGKKTGAKPTLQASGDMLGSMIVNLPSSFDKLEIAFSDEIESQKAHGHVNGSDILPKRDFFGLTQAELNQIRSKWNSEVDDAVALDLVGQTIEQGEQTDLNFILRMLDGEG